MMTLAADDDHEAARSRARLAVAAAVAAQQSRCTINKPMLSERIVASDEDDDYKTPSSREQPVVLAAFATTSTTTSTIIRDHDQSRPPASISGRRSKLSQMQLQTQMPQRAHLRQTRGVFLTATVAAAATLLLLLLLLQCQPIDSIQFAGKSIKSNQYHHHHHELRLKRQASDEESAAATTTATTTTAAPTTTTTTTTAAAAAAATTTTAAATTAEASGKIKAVNFTLVDELFDSVLSDSEVSSKWRHMDKQITDGVRAILKAIFPHVVAMSQDAKVSGNCSGAILKWILNLRNLRSWAVRMLDSIGKPSAGLLEGSLTLFGNYKQCLAVRAPDEDEIEEVDGEFREYFRGQYCVLQMRPNLPAKRPFYNLNSTISSLMRQSYKYYEKSIYDELAELAMAFHFVTIRADLCVPSLCSRDDIQRVADFLAKKVDMRARVARCDIEPTEEDGYSIEAGQLIWSMIFVVLLLLVLISTSVSWLYSMKRVKPNKSKAHSLATSMSLSRSLSHIKNIHFDRINESKPALLYSLRLIVVLWLCLVQLVSQLDFQYLRELLPMRSIIMDWPMQLIVNSSLAFDSLILLTAFTYSYSNINCNLTDLVKYNLSKYSRLMPSIMLMVALQIVTPLLYANKSPVWHDFVDKPAQVCKSNGLVNLLFLQNFLQYDQICLPQTWLFCVELQLCLLSIPIVYLLNKNFDTNQGRFKLATLPTLGLIYVALFGCVMNFLTIYWNSLPAAWFLTFPDKADRNVYYSLYLTKSWSHLSSFAVGLFAGHLCRCMAIDTFSGRPYGRRCCDNLMWLASAILMAGLIFSTHSWSLSGSAHLESPIASALYGSLGQLLWSLSWAMILFNLTVPNDKNQTNSMLARLLTSDLNLIRLGRLTFLAYLVNPYVNMVVLAAQEQAIFSSLLMLGHTFIGNLVFTFGIALLISALVELPCRRLIKKLLLGSRRQCTNLGVITRQLNIHQQNQGPSHDSFVAQEKQRAAAVGQQQQQQPMIPLR